MDPIRGPLAPPRLSLSKARRFLKSTRRAAANAWPLTGLVPAKPPSFIDVPDLLVNLVGLPGERVQYLKVKVVLEVKEEKQAEVIKPAMPRVVDIFQTYMRELRASDLNGSAGLFRLKVELTKRVNVAVSPSEVSAVLFKEIVVQ